MTKNQFDANKMLQVALQGTTKFDKSEYLSDDTETCYLCKQSIHQIIENLFNNNNNN